MGMMKHDPVRGWVPAVPEPFWVRRWFRWKPACYACQVVFDRRDSHDEHWTQTHGLPGR